MRIPTEREIFLQNLLATSSTLLYRSVSALERGTPTIKESLIIEIEEWFSEAQAQIRAALAEDDYSPQQTPVVEKPQAPAPVWQAPSKDEGLAYFLR